MYIFYVIISFITTVNNTIDQHIYVKIPTKYIYRKGLYFNSEINSENDIELTIYKKINEHEHFGHKDEVYAPNVYIDNIKDLLKQYAEILKKHAFNVECKDAPINDMIDLYFIGVYQDKQMIEIAIDLTGICYFSLFDSPEFNIETFLGINTEHDRIFAEELIKIYNKYHLDILEATETYKNFSNNDYIKHIMINMLFMSAKIRNSEFNEHNIISKRILTLSNLYQYSIIHEKKAKNSHFLQMQLVTIFYNICTLMGIEMSEAKNQLGISLKNYREIALSQIVPKGEV